MTDSPKRKNKPGAGRPPVSDEERLRTTTIRLSAKQLDEFYALGGVNWLRAQIAQAVAAQGESRLSSK